MLLTQKLLRLLNSVFDKDARAFTAFRIRHESGRLRWRIEDRVLTGSVDGVGLFEVALAGYTIRTLLEHLATLPGITVISRVSTEQFGLSAGALMDQSGDQASSNGDQVLAFTSLLWAYLEAMAVELREARRQIDEALLQMSAKTAEAEWLDEWGGYFGFPRKGGEADASYSKRIVEEVLRPRGNNKAIEIGLRDVFGQESQVIDLQKFGDAFPEYDGVISHNGAHLHSASAIPYYGLFKIVIGYDLLGGSDISGYINEVRSYVETMRDAGTHLESVELGGSLIADAMHAEPTDSSNIQVLSAIATLVDAVQVPVEFVPAALIRVGDPPASFINPNPDPFSEDAPVGAEFPSGTVSYTTAYSGLRVYNGAVPHAGGTSAALVLS